MPERPTEWIADDAALGDLWWGIYARLSMAGDEDETGVDRQIADGLKEARRRGAKRVRIYADDGFSAYKRKVVRPRFEALLEDIADGRLPGGVVAWRAERLARRPKDAQRLIDALDAEEPNPRSIAYTISDGVDTSTDPGLFVFRQLVEFGRWESKAISQRVARAHLSRFEAGRFGGSPPAFGHKDGTAWREVEPAAAEAIRLAAQRLIAGEGVMSILRDWAARGITTRTGQRWQHPAWRKMMMSPRIAGLRVLRGLESSGVDAKGLPWIAPILDLESWRSVKRIFEDPSRRTNGTGDARHLLTSILRCGNPKCLGSLRAKGNAGRKNGPDYWTYGCSKDYGHPEACGRIWIKGSHTDAYIEGVVLAALSDPAVIAALTRASSGEPADDWAKEETDLRADLLATRERIIAVEMAWMKGPAALEAEIGISPEGYRRWRAGEVERRDDIERQLARLVRTRSVVRAIADPDAFWAAATLQEKREIVRAVCPAIVVRQAASIPEFPQRWDRRRIAITLAG